MSQVDDLTPTDPRANLAVTDGGDPEAELTYLRRKAEDYGVALAALAVVTERLRIATGETLVIIDDVELADAPNLIARRDPQMRRLGLTTGRGD